MKFHGPIAMLSTPTVDARVVTAIFVDRLPVPVLAFLDENGKVRNPSGGGHFDPRQPTQVGCIDRVELTMSTVYAYGVLYDDVVEGARCGVGIDLGNLVTTHDVTHRVETMTGTLLGAHLNVDSGAWPSTWIEVERTPAG